MAIYQDKNKSTKDGRTWYFRVYYTNLNGERKQYKSPMYKSKKETLSKEREFILFTIDTNYNTSMKFKDLYLAYLEHQKKYVKDTTYRSYKVRIKYLKELSNIKINDFNIRHYEIWYKHIDELNLSISYKNNILKFFKNILNFGKNWYNFNFNNIYNKIVKFTNQNELPKEMCFYNLEEFKILISYEKDLMWRTLFEILYYCGLRNGEMRGILWEDIDFNKKTIRINKQIPTDYGSKNYKFTSTKTKNSTRVLPLCNILFSDLKSYYEYVCKLNGFNSKWFVFGNMLPMAPGKPSEKLDELCKISGIKKIRIHDFRHSCASLLINSGANITVVAKYLGHSKIDETLNTYSHMFESSLNQILDTINNLK